MLFNILFFEYVRKDGNDSNPGTENSAAGAYATTERAIQELQGITGANQDITITLGDATPGDPHNFPINLDGVEGYSSVRIESENGAANCAVRSPFSLTIFSGFRSIRLVGLEVVNTTGSFIFNNSLFANIDNCIISSAPVLFSQGGTSVNVANTSFAGSYAPSIRIFQVQERGFLGIGASCTFTIGISVLGTLIEAKDYSEVDFGATVTGLDLATIDIQTHSVARFSNMTRDANNQPDQIDDTSIVTYSNETVTGSPQAIQGAFDSDANAGLAGVTAGQFYETDGTGTMIPFSRPGIVMVKQ